MGVAQAVSVVGIESAFAPGADGKYTISAPGIKAQVSNKTQNELATRLIV